MTNATGITTLFIDIGGVILTDGWNRKWRKAAVSKFNLDYEDMDNRHHLTYDTYEVGKISLDEYLTRVVFYKNRDFTAEDFKNFMFEQSQPFPEMIELICRLKETYRLKVAVVSNEGRELTEYRIKKFNLHRFVDFFVSSCFVHLRKPDTDIFKLALDVAQIPLDQIIYIEDRLLFIQVAATLGIKGIQHIDYQTTKAQLEIYGLKLAEEPVI